MAFSLSTVGLLAALIPLALVLLYRAILPRPISGIPYDREAAKQLFGDVPEALKYHARTEQMLGFLVERCKQLQSPICQVFMRPFARPWVVVCDGRESQDIMTRRGHELDRSDFFGDLFGTILPNNQAVLRTNDHWRSNRRLVADTMSPSFLNNIASHFVYTNAMDLVDLWVEKTRLAKGRTFEVWKDVQMCTVDTIWAVSFGGPIDACKSQAEFLRSQRECDLPADENSTVSLPAVSPPDSYNALSLLAKSSEIPMNSPLGRKAHWLAIRFVPQYRKALALRDRLIDDMIQAAAKRMGSNESKQVRAQSAVDHVVQREAARVKKEDRRPLFNSPDVSSELGGFLQAGFETTASTLSWGLKYLTGRQDVQRKLKEELKTAFGGSSSVPDAESIAKTSLPYLDAFIEEVLRHSGTVPANIRIATHDTQILGHVIPKGTDVFLMNCGPSFLEDAMNVEEVKRSRSSQESNKDRLKYQATDLGDFRPERWLKITAEGEVQFDPQAAPMQTFGLGTRGCFGKRLAYLEMRVIFVLLLWHFHLQEVPESLFDFKARDVLTHQPQNVRIRLASAA